MKAQDSQNSKIEDVEMKEDCDKTEEKVEEDPSQSVKDSIKNSETLSKQNKKDDLKIEESVVIDQN